MSQVTVTLPDGSSRQLAAGSPVREVAAAISPRLAEAALAAVVDDRLVDLSTPLVADARVRVVTDKSDEALGSHASQHGAPDGRRRDGAVSRHPVRHRTGHRRRLLLRLRRQPAVCPRGPRGHRGEDARAGRCGPAVRTAVVAARGGARLVRPAGRAAQGPVDRGEDGGPVARLGLHDQGPRDVRRLLRRPACPVVGQAEGVQVALDLQRLLEGRREQRANAARLRHGVSEREGAQGVPHADRGSQATRPPQGRPRDGAVSLPSVGARRARSGWPRARRCTTRSPTTCATCCFRPATSR